ncbi:hypothetical protein MKW94_025898 [Papaver nudicaule]|uniref:Helicase C-terminal domain-containing protein n=1 Tax=Papaver nudicaule TaxID=74823 RepID=A0AA41VPS1_PAPNU|nr:hypothetical protein [Papaver nudicaule]
MEEDTDQVEQPPLFSNKKFTPKVSKKPPPVIENLPQSNEPLEIEKSCDPDSYTLSFSDLGLELGMKKPTQVQHHCIPQLLLWGDDGFRNTYFESPVAENPYGVYALVITPIREALGACLHLRCAVVVGGMDMIIQAQALMQRPHVIATPGWIEPYEGFKTVESLEQQYIFVPKNVKDVYLLHVLSKMEDMGVRSAIIFVSTCRLSALHRFKSVQTPILLATDVASRGLDIPTVDLVINYCIPRYARDYVHRVGRTARAGRGGLAVSFVTQNDVDLIHEIRETVVGKQLDKFECKENDVLAEISKVYKARRVATMKMMDDGFKQKAEDQKAEKGLLKEKTKKRRIARTTSVEHSK